MTACEAMTVAAVARKTSGQLAPVGHEQEERAADVGRVVEDQRALPQVAEDARREDQEQPRAGDRRAPEMPHVGVQRLRAGDGEHDRGQREERDREVAEEEAQRVGRRERLEDLGVLGDAAARRRRRSTTNQTIITGPNRRPTVAVPSALEQEQRDDDRRRDRDDQVLERRATRPSGPRPPTAPRSPA